MVLCFVLWWAYYHQWRENKRLVAAHAEVCSSARDLVPQAFDPRIQPNPRLPESGKHRFFEARDRLISSCLLR